MIRILIADDQSIFLEGLSNLIGEQEDFQIVAKANNGEEVLEKLRETEVDIALLDLNMPVMNGLTAMEVIQRDHPKTKVIFLTIYQEQYVINQLLQLGACGFILKNGSLDKLFRALRSVYNGEKFFEDIEGIIDKPAQPPITPHKLTPQEIKIIKLVTEGHASAAIGGKLFISEYTVNTHRRNILKKLKLENTAQLVAFAKSSGIIR